MKKMTDSQYQIICEKLAYNIYNIGINRNDLLETMKSICDSLLEYSSNLKNYLLDKDYPKRYLSNYLFNDIFKKIPRI